MGRFEREEAYASSDPEDWPFEFMWVSWRTKKKWSVRHAVAALEDASPDEVAGFVTVCMKRVPVNAIEYSHYPRGIARNNDRYRLKIGLRLAGAPYVDDEDLCPHCKSKLEKMGAL